MSDDPQAAFKARIKLWLESPNRSRDWLSTKVGTSEKTVNNWLSSAQKIPQGKAQLIERLMSDDATAEAQLRAQLLPQAQVFSLEVDLPTFRSYNAAALKANQTLEQWSITELNAAAEAALSSKNPDSEAPPEDTTPEIIEREANVAGTKLRIIQQPQYQAAPQESLKVAEETPAQQDFSTAISQAAAEIDAAAGNAPNEQHGKSAG